MPQQYVPVGRDGYVVRNVDLPLTVTQFARAMNWRSTPELGAPVVSLGGAGTFDGIYITGLVSVLLI